MIGLSVTTRGIPKAKAYLERTQSRLYEAMMAATREGAELEAELVREATPVMIENRGGSDRYPGELRDSIAADVQRLETGRVIGTVSTGISWAPFVEHGTVKHGRARHMFQIGAREARPEITLIFEAHIAAAMDT